MANIRVEVHGELEDARITTTMEAEGTPQEEVTLTENLVRGAIEETVKGIKDLMHDREIYERMKREESGGSGTA
jgi:hypothetical protein